MTLSSSPFIHPGHPFARIATLPGRLVAWLGLDELTRLERHVMASAGVVMVGLLVALASTCQESVLRGERLRAEQRQGASVQVASVPRILR